MCCEKSDSLCAHNVASAKTTYSKYCSVDSPLCPTRTADAWHSLINIHKLYYFNTGAKSKGAHRRTCILSHYIHGVPFKPPTF